MGYGLPIKRENKFLPSFFLYIYICIKKIKKVRRKKKECAIRSYKIITRFSISPLNMLEKIIDNDVY